MFKLYLQTLFNITFNLLLETIEYGFFQSQLVLENIFLWKNEIMNVVISHINVKLLKY